MAPTDPQNNQSVPRFVLIAFGLAALALAGSLLFYTYRRSGDEVGAPLQSIPAFSGTTESGIAPLVTDLDGLPEAGSVAPDFELPDIEGEIVRLRDYRGRPVVLNFWATWCAPCRLEMPELQRAQADYDAETGGNGPVVLTINQEEGAEQVGEFFDEVGLTLPALLDSNADVGVAYGAFFLPTTVIIGPDGIVAAVHRGIISRDQLDGYLAEIDPAEGS
jgi:peroxiredoxin